MFPPPSVYSDSSRQQVPEDYSQAILMYQKGFQEIIDFKNQYMEEVMKMRERVIKEREEILEYEKVKHQQTLEIQNLKAVYDRLGDMLHEQPPPQRQTERELTGSSKMNPLVQSNLNTLLAKQ
jgi:hypothetical protein